MSLAAYLANTTGSKGTVHDHHFPYLKFTRYTSACRPAFFAIATGALHAVFDK